MKKSEFGYREFIFRQISRFILGQPSNNIGQDGVFMENPTPEDIKRETMDMLKRLKNTIEKENEGENVTIKERGDGGFDIILEKSKVVYHFTDTGEIIKPSD